MGEDFSLLLSNMAQLDIKIKEQIEDKDVKDSTNSLRTLRKRSTSEDLLHKTRNRKVHKPKKNTNGALQFENEKEVKNFYLNINKKVKLKPVLLETIHEQDESISEEIESESTNIGGKKILKKKRMLTITDGLNVTRTLKDKRKNLIKKHLPGKKRPRKIALSRFMEYFKQKISDDTVDVPDTKLNGEFFGLPSCSLER